MTKSLLLAAACAAVPSIAFGQTLYSSNAESLGDFIVTATSDTTVNVVDYSNYTAFSVPQSLPEAPNSAPGDAATTGIGITANQLAGATNGVNLFPSTTGLTPDAFTGIYTLQFDFWINVDPTIIPVSGSGSTEQLVYGVGRSDTDFLGRSTRFVNNEGVFGYATSDGGFGTEDYTLRGPDGNILDVFGNDVEPALSKFPDGPLAGAAGNAWHTASIVVDSVNGSIDVYYDGTLFHSVTGLAALDLSGGVFVGYEDSFASLSINPDEQFGVIDNVFVFAGEVLIPEPASLGLLGMAGLGLMRRRK